LLNEQTNRQTRAGKEGEDITTSVVIGIDIGTSGTKAIAVTQAGAVLDSITVGYGLMAPEAGFAEQNPLDWWNATVEAVSGLVEKNAGLNVEAISFSGQMHGLVPMDGEGQVIRPAIIWCDLRSTREAKWLEENIGRKAIIEWTENPPLVNFTLTKLLWMRNNEPDNYQRIAKILLPKDYVRFRMTGDLHMDMADASGTLLFDVSHRRWSSEMCKAVGILESWLPELCESTDIVGHVTREASQLLCVPAGIPVVAGAGDQAAGAVGLGAKGDGIVTAAFGTSGVVLASTSRPVRDENGCLHTFCHAIPNQWFVMGVTQSAGGSFQWLRNRFAKAATFDGLTELARLAPPGSENLLFLPYLMGERTPHLDPNARGAWIGLDWRHEASHLVRALLEGVSFSLLDGWKAMESISVKARTWRVTGGGAKSRLWMEIFSGVLGHSVEVVRGQEGPAYGAAILAAMGISWDTAHGEWVSQGELISAPAGWSEAYQRLYPLYREAYSSLHGLYQKLANEI
jgi:xylulokinase